MTELGTRISQSRHLILKAEIGALLHDIGKLNPEWYEYRANWRQLVKDDDPHTRNFLGNDRVLEDFPALKEVLERTCAGQQTLDVFPQATDFSVRRMVHEHTVPTDEFTRILKACDSLDAAQDRNNPLVSSAQRRTVYLSDTFGKEQRLHWRSLGRERRRLYEELEHFAPTYLSNFEGCSLRRGVVESIKGSFEKGLADTTRPDNDTSLWEHCYAVACLFKAATVHKLIYREPLDSIEKVRFGILGIGWDAFRFLSQGEKLGDVTGRAQLLQDLTVQVQEKIEYGFLLGNMVYRDDNGICFLVPRVYRKQPCTDDYLRRQSEYLEYLVDVKREIVALALTVTNGDIQPHFYMVPDTSFMTQVTRCISRLGEMGAYPLAGNDFKDKVASFWNVGVEQVHEVCPICRRRPVLKKDKDVGACEECHERRTRIFKIDAPRRASVSEIALGLEEIEKKELREGTGFISEITAAAKARNPSKRAALIVATFNLDRWLSGQMVRTLFVKPPLALEAEVEDMGKTNWEAYGQRAAVVENRAREALRKAQPEDGPRYSYSWIQKETDNLYSRSSTGKDLDYRRGTGFLLGRRKQCYQEGQLRSHLGGLPHEWDELITSAREESGPIDIDRMTLLANLICAKTPTPSTVLDIWTTTEKFFDEIAGSKMRGWLEPRSRLVVEMERPRDAHPLMIHGGEFNGNPVELLWLTDKVAFVAGLDWPDDQAGRTSIEDHMVGVTGNPWQARGAVEQLRIIRLVRKHHYRPFRLVSKSPVLFMAIVPAGEALTVTANIYDQFVSRFGKVMGRLPLSVGNIFFNEHTPMFAVLDAGRRMAANFRALMWEPVKASVSTASKFDLAAKHLTLDGLEHGEQSPRGVSFRWKISGCLGNTEPDYYHPYLIVKKDGRDYSGREGYFKTMAGDVVHASAVRSGDTLQVFPPYYDFEFLDTTTRRYDLALEDGRRRSCVTGVHSRPYVLEGSTRGLAGLWARLKSSGDDDLMPGLTDSQLRNIESLWLTKLKEWQVDLGRPESEAFCRWSSLVTATLRKEFPRYRDPDDGCLEDLEYLQEAVFSGMFFDCLELHLRILKEKVEKTQKGE